MSMWKKSRGVLFGLILGVVLTGAFLGAGGASEIEDIVRFVPFKLENLWLMKQARAIIETYQVDSGEKPVEETKLVYGAMKGFVQAYGDPYTRFVDPEELKEEEIEMEGEYGGLGIYLGHRDGKTLVISPIEGTPADRVGLKPGDEIVKIGDEVIIGWESQQVVKKLRGPAGTSVTIWVRRDKEDKLLRFDIQRENIKLFSVRSEMIDKDTGYIRISQFKQKTGEEVKNAIIDLEQKGAKGLIVDLRNNGGGLLSAAVDVSDLFLDGGLVVSMEGRVDRANDKLYAKPGQQTTLPLVVLVNEGSASASEIVAGALMDRQRAILVGKKSFGKGSVQTLFNLSDGSGLYVTIARYHTPSGVTIDHVGLTPQLTVEGEYNPDRKKDPQLKRAIEELAKIEKGTSSFLK